MSDKKNRKTIVATQKQPVLRMKQKDLDSSCHRLSRLPQKYNHNKAVTQAQQQPFVAKYYNENPDALDLRSPVEKLNDIEEMLQSENLDSKEKLRLLAQQRQLNLFVSGEESLEMLRSYELIGIHYKEMGRPPSAVRNLSKAHQMESIVNVDPEETVLIAVHTAEAYLQMRDNNKKESEVIKFLNQANDVLKPVLDIELSEENDSLFIKRAIVISRVTASRGYFDEAFGLYEEARAALEEKTPDNQVDIANLLVEMAENAKYAKKNNEAYQYLVKAREIYQANDMEDEAQALDPKINELKPANAVEEEEEYESESQSSNHNPKNNNEEEEDEKIVIDASAAADAAVDEQQDKEEKESNPLDDLNDKMGNALTG